MAAGSRRVPGPDAPARRAGGPDVSVVTSGHDVADARLHRTVAALRRAGLTVEVVGLGRAEDGPAGADVSVRPRGSMQRRALAAATLPLTARGQVLLTLDPDLVPAANLRRLVGRLRGRPHPVVVDVHEDYLALLEDRAWAQGPAGRVARLLARGSTALARRADLTVVADEQVPPGQARDRLVVRNLPDAGYLPPPSDPDPVPRALYVGDLRRSRGLFTMLDAVAAAPPWRLDLVGAVAAADQPELDRWLASTPGADRVTLHGRMPPHQAWALARGAWAGLALLDDTPAFRAAMPTKVYEYLGAGLAVVVTPLPRLVSLVTSSQAGAVAGDAAAVSDRLRSWSSAPDSLVAAREAALRWAREHLDGPNPYDELAARVRTLVTRSVPDHPATDRETA